MHLNESIYSKQAFGRSVPEPYINIARHSIIYDVEQAQRCGVFAVPADYIKSAGGYVYDSQNFFGKIKLTVRDIPFDLPPFIVHAELQPACNKSKIIQYDETMAILLGIYETPEIHLRNLGVIVLSRTGNDFTVCNISEKLPPYIKLM